MRYLFVYGSLRKGQRAAYMLEGFDSEKASLPGAHMYTLGPWPFIVLDPTASTHVKGELITVPEWAWEKTVAQLDRYEGYPHLFDRVEVEVLTHENPRMVEATVYVAASVENRVDDALLVEGGDWVEHLAGRMARASN